jgi:GH18 family chitinase
LYIFLKLHNDHRGQSIDLSDGFRKACDVVYFDIFNLNPKTDVVTTIAETDSESKWIISVFLFNLLTTIAMMEHADVLQEAGVKVIGGFRLWETSENLNRISAKADLREKFAARIMAVMEELQLDGLFLQWMWPACPMVKFINWNH